LSEPDKTPTEAEEIVSEFQKTKESTPEPDQVSEPQIEPASESESSVQEAESQPPQQEAESQPPQQEAESQPPQQEAESQPPKQEEAENEKTSAETQTKTEDSTRSERNVIYVGLKPLMVYVTATLTQLAGLPTVTIKARGKRITQAVDVSQMIVKRMNAVGYKISDVRIASDSLTSQDGKLRNVSTIEIDVSKP